MIVQMMGGAPTRTPPPPRAAGVERWGCNNLILKPQLRLRFEGWTRWFDLHSTEHIQGRKGGRSNVYPWLCQQTRPIYRWAVDPAMPSSVVYPQAARNGSRLFCSTLDWMLALAIYERAEEIHLFGWRMSHPAYEYQISSGQWWIQEAQSRGIRVVNHSSSQLFLKMPKQRGPTPDTGKCLMYGLETTDRSKLFHAV